jgi:hypothetical protein
MRRRICAAIPPQGGMRTRTALDAFLKKNRAQLWIQHDVTANRALRKAPAFYD